MNKGNSKSENYNRNQGSSNRLRYDECAYEQQLSDSTTPFQYRTNIAAYENCEKCKADKFWYKYDTELVDVESELRNINRPATKCASLKFHPNCEKSNTCMSTFDKSAPIILAPEVCPIVFNNIPRQTSNGMREVLALNCDKKQ
jgi:hypothetical protein